MLKNETGISHISCLLFIGTTLLSILFYRLNNCFDIFITERGHAFTNIWWRYDCVDDVQSKKSRRFPWGKQFLSDLGIGKSVTDEILSLLQLFRSQVRSHLRACVQILFQFCENLTKQVYDAIATKFISAILADIGHHARYVGNVATSENTRIRQSKCLNI